MKWNWMTWAILHLMCVTACWTCSYRLNEMHWVVHWCEPKWIVASWSSRVPIDPIEYDNDVRINRVVLNCIAWIWHVLEWNVLCSRTWLVVCAQTYLVFASSVASMHCSCCVSTKSKGAYITRKSSFQPGSGKISSSLELSSCQTNDTWCWSHQHELNGLSSCGRQDECHTAECCGICQPSIYRTISGQRLPSGIS